MTDSNYGNRPLLTLAVDVHNTGRVHQGSRTFIENVYRELPAIDERVRVISFGEIKPPDFPVWRHVPVDLGPPVKRLTWGSLAALAALRPDYVHYQYFCPILPVGRSVITVHDILPLTHPEFFNPSFSRRFRLMLALSMRFATLVNAVSDFTREAIVDHYRLDPTRIAIVPNAVSTELFTAVSREEAKARVAERFGLTLYALSVTRIERRKNIPLLIDAVAELAANEFPHLTTVLLGSIDESAGNGCEKTRHAIAEGRVVHLTGLDDRDKALILRAAEVLVFPSLAEGFGIPPLEGMAAGLPVIVADRTAHGQIYRNSAVMISGTDVSELVARMRELLSTEAYWHDAAARGRAFAATMTWRRSATALIDSLRRDAEARGHPTLAKS